MISRCAANNAVACMYGMLYSSESAPSYLRLQRQTKLLRMSKCIKKPDRHVKDTGMARLVGD